MYWWFDGVGFNVSNNDRRCVLVIIGVNEEGHKELEAFDRFIEEYGAKYPKAGACLEKDKIELLAFYDFPAEHWVHLRTTNPIESTCATVRNRISDDFNDRVQINAKRAEALAKIKRLSSVG